MAEKKINYLDDNSGYDDPNKKKITTDIKLKDPSILFTPTESAGYSTMSGYGNFGKSKYDTPLTSDYFETQEGDSKPAFEYVRGARQSHWDKAAHGIIRGVGAAAQTLYDGTAGIGYGIIRYSSDLALDELNKKKYIAEHGSLEGFKPSSWTTIFDNEVTRKGEELVKDLEGKVPLYNTREYEEASGIEKFKYMNFWMDDVVKGIGTTVGSMPLGAMGSKLFNAIGKNFVAGKLANGVKTALNGTENLEKILVDQAKKIKIYNATDKLTASAFASVSEAGMEARGTGDKLREQLLSEISANGTRQPTQAELDWVEMTVDDAKKAAFGTNMAIISGTDFYTFGKYMVSNKSAKYLDDIEKVTSKTNVNAGKYINKVAKDGSKLGTDYTATELSKSKKIYDAVTKATKRVIGTNLGEGIEENLQTATDWGVIDFAKQKYYGKQDAESFLHSLGAAYEGATSSEGVEAFLAGFISGGISNTILSKGQNIKEAFSKDPVVNNALSQINLYNSQSVMGELMKGVAEQYAAGVRMDNAKSDTFTFNNAQSDLATSYVLSRIKTGKFEDLQTDLDELKSMPSDEVEKLFGVKIGEGGKRSVVDYIQGKMEQAKQIKQIHDASYVVFPEGTVSDNNRDRLIHANVSILDSQKRIDSVNKDILEKTTGLSENYSENGQVSTVNLSHFTKSDGTVVNYNQLSGKERSAVSGEIVARLENSSIAPVEIPGIFNQLHDLDRLKVRHDAYKDIYNSLLNPVEAAKLDKEDAAIEKEIVQENAAKKLQEENPIVTKTTESKSAALAALGGTTTSSDKKADIERRRKEELDENNFRFVDNVKTYEGIDPETGEIFQARVKTYKDGKKETQSNIGGKFSTLNKGFPKEVNDEKLLEGIFEDNKMSLVKDQNQQEFLLEQSSGKQNTHAIEDKINAKYDAELAAAQKEATENGNIDVNTEDFADPNIKKANTIIDKIGESQIDNPMFDASGNFNPDAEDPGKKTYDNSKKPLTVHKEVLSGKDTFNRIHVNKHDAPNVKVNELRKALSNIFKLPKSEWNKYIKIDLTNYWSTRNTSSDQIHTNKSNSPFNTKGNQDIDTKIIIIDPATGKIVDDFHNIKYHNMLTPKKEMVIGTKTYKPGESIEIDQLTYEEAVELFAINQDEELTEEEFEAYKISYKEIKDLRKALTLYYESTKKKDEEHMEVPSKMYDVAPLWALDYIQDGAVEYPAISTIEGAKDTDGKYVIYQGGTVQKFLIGTDTKVGDINTVPNGSGVYLQVTLPDGSKKWMPIKSAKVKPATKVWERIQNAAAELAKIPAGNKEEAYQVIKDLSLYAAGRGKLDFSYGWNSDLKKYTLRFNVGNGLETPKSIDLSEGVSKTDKATMLEKDLNFLINRINYHANKRGISTTIDENSFREDTPIEPSNKPIVGNFVATATGFTPTSIKVYPADLAVKEAPVVLSTAKKTTSNVVLTDLSYTEKADIDRRRQEELDSFKRKMEGIDFVFSQSPELASIGNKAQYLQYLSTIFKTSKVKDIVYHFSNVKIDKPSKEKFSLSANINRRKGFFGINKNINPGNNFANVEGTIPHAMLFDMKNPDFGDFSIIPPVVAKDETKDSAIIKQRGDINYYSVFEPEQIYILGSKQDIEGFKQFVRRRQAELAALGKGVETTKNKVDKLIEEAKELKDKGVSRKRKGKNGAAKTGSTTKTPIDLQKALDYLKGILPAGIKVEMSHVAEKLSNGDMLWGFFSDSVLKLNALAEAGTEFHEAFHAVFRSVLSDKQIDTYLSVAKKEMNLSEAQLEARKNELRSLYDEISEKELEDLVYEEYLADKFQAWKKDKATPTAVVNKGLFRRLLDFAKEFLGIKSKVDSLFERIDTGYYAGKDAVINRFTDTDQAAYKSLPGKTIAQSKDIIVTVAAKAAETAFKEKSKKPDITRALDEYIQGYSSEANVDEKKAVRALLQEEYEYLTHPEIYKQIFTEVNNITKRYKYDAMTDSFLEMEESEGGAENWQFDHFEVGGVDMLDSDIRSFLALTLYETKDEYGRTIQKAINLDTVYNAIITNLIDVHPSEFLSRLKVLSKYNPEVRAVVAKIEAKTKDRGLVGEQLLKKIQKSFERTKMNYLTIRSVTNGTSNIFNSNYKSPEKKLFNNWSNNYIHNILGKLSSDTKFKKEVIKKLLDIQKAINNDTSTVGVKKIPLKEAIISTLNELGIDITEGTVDLFFTPNTDNSLDAIREQYKDLEKPIVGFFSHLSNLVSKGDLIYKGALETNDKDSVGYVKQLLNLAIADKHFRADLFESSFQDARNKNRYSFIMQSYLSDMIIELQKGLSSKTAVEEKQKDPYFAKSPLFKLFTPAVIADTFSNMQLLFTGDLIEVEEKTFDGKKSFTKNERVDGVTAKNIKAKEYLLMQLLLFSDQQKNTQTGLNTAKYVVGVEESKSQIYAVDLPVLTGVVTEAGMINGDGALQIFNTIFSQEIDRLINGIPSKKKGFAYFNDFNNREKYKALHDTFEGEYNTKGELVKINRIANNDTFKAEALKAITQTVNEEITDVLSMANEYQLADRTKNGVETYGTFDKLVGSAVVNDFLMSSSIDQLVDGDLSQYKDIDDKFKRNGGRNAAGINRSGSEINVAYTTESKETKKDSISGDAEINVDDAQVYSSVQDRINMLSDFGRLTPEIEDILNRIDNPPIVNGVPQFITEEEASKVDLVAAKLVTYGKDNAGNLIYHKMSVFPLTKQFTSRYDAKSERWVALPGREKLHNKREWMEKHNIHQLIPLSASKLTSPDNIIKHESFNSSDFDVNNHFGYKDKDGNLKSYAKYNGKFQRLQVENDSGSTEIVNGTQKIQLITAGLDMTKDSNVNDVKKYYELLAKLRQTLFDDALSILSTSKEGKTRRKDLKVFINKLMNNAASSGSSFIMEQFLAEEGGDFKNDPNLPHLLSQFEKYFLAHFNKGVMIQKTTGNKLTLVSADGIKVHRDNYGKVISAEELAVNPKLAVNPAEDLRIHKMENGKLQYAEVMMTRRSAELLGLKPGDSLTAEEVKIMLGTRIPSQSQHSMMPFKVVDFLPDYYGDSIIGPKELVWLSGADFDIDKLYVYRKGTYRNKKGDLVIFGKGNAFEEYTLSKKNTKVFKDTLEKMVLENPTFPEYKDLLDRRNAIYASLEENLAKSKKEDQRALLRGIKNLKNLIKINAINSKEDEDHPLVQERRKAQLLFDSIKDDLDKYTTAAGGGMSLSSINDRITQFEEAYELDAMEELGFITSSTESVPPAAETLQNQLLDLELSLLDRPELEESLKTPASVDTLKTIANTLTKVGGAKLNKARLSLGLLSKFIGKKNIDIGKENIGIAANGNIANAWLTTNRIHLKDEFAINLDGKNYGSFEFVNEEDMVLNEDGTLNKELIRKPKSDTISTELSAATDNAKEQLASLVNRASDILNGVLVWQSLGLGQTRTTIMAVQPIMVELTEKIELTKSNIDKKSLKIGTSMVPRAKDVAGALMEDLMQKFYAAAEKEMEAANIKGTREDIKEPQYSLNTEQLLEIYKKGKAETSDEILQQIAVLGAYIKAMEVNDANTKLLSLLKVNKGVGSELTNLETIAENYEALQDSAQIPYGQSFVNALRTHPNIKVNKDMARTIKNIASEFFIRETGGYKIFQNRFGKLFGNRNFREKQKAVKDFLTFLNLRIYEKTLREDYGDDSFRLDELNKLAYPGIEEGSVSIIADFNALLKTDSVLEVASNSKKEFAKNDLVKWLTVKPADSNYRRIDLLTVDTRAKLSNDVLEKFNQSLNDLYNSSNADIKQFAQDIFDYLVVEGNLKFTNESLIKFIGPEFFLSISKKLKEVTKLFGTVGPKELSVEDKTFNAKLQTATGYTFSELVNMYTELYARSTKNAKNLINVHGKDFKESFTVTLNKDVLSVDLIDVEKANQQSFMEGIVEDKTVVGLKFPAFLGVVGKNQMMEDYHDVYKLTESTDFKAVYTRVDKFYDLHNPMLHLSPEEATKLSQYLASKKGSFNGAYSDNVEYTQGDLDFANAQFQRAKPEYAYEPGSNIENAPDLDDENLPGTIPASLVSRIETIGEEEYEVPLRYWEAADAEAERQQGKTPDVDDNNLPDINDPNCD